MRMVIQPAMVEVYGRKGMNINYRILFHVSASGFPAILRKTVNGMQIACAVAYFLIISQLCHLLLSFYTFALS
jgi:hypothetical protein